jgi:hypothetical protein
MVYHYDFALPYETWEMEFEEWFSIWPLRLPLKVWRRDTMPTTETELGRGLRGSIQGKLLAYLLFSFV